MMILISGGTYIVDPYYTEHPIQNVYNVTIITSPPIGAGEKFRIIMSKLQYCC